MSRKFTETTGGREERLMARIRAAANYYSELTDRARRSGFNPYCHIPDLFDVDTEANLPVAVPQTFISEQVGGHIPVVNPEGVLLDQEPLDMLLSSFLPGGYKNRWDFKKWTGRFEGSIEDGFVDVSAGFVFEDTYNLEELLGGGVEEYTPFRYDTSEVGLYVPEQLTVLEVPEHTVYQWDTKHNCVYHYKPDDLDEGHIEPVGRSDPSSRFFWFKHLHETEGEHAPVTLGDETGGLLGDATFADDATFLKCYYATLLTLYHEDQTFSEVVRYRNDETGEKAFVTSEERSQVLSFDIIRDKAKDGVESVLDARTDVRRELRFARLYQHIWDRLFFDQRSITNVYEVDPFFRVLRAVDYWFRTRRGSKSGLFDASIEEISTALGELIPDDSTTRLRLLGFDASHRESFRDLLTEEAGELRDLLQSCADDEKLQTFGEHVFVHSLKHALATWATEAGVGGSDFEAWYDINFQESAEEAIQIAIYDQIQGGSGTSKEVYKRLRDGEVDVASTLLDQGDCHISSAEDLIPEMLVKYDAEFLYELHEQNRDRLNTLVEDELRERNLVPESHQQDTSEGGETINHELSNGSGDETSEVAMMFRQRLRSLFETRELAKFYGTVATTYQRTEDELGRTPGPVEIVLALEGETFFDAGIRQTYERFANRGSKRKDVSELADRVEELTKQCVRACPDCLERRGCSHAHRYQTQLLDKRLLVDGLTHILKEGSR